MSHAFLLCSSNRRINAAQLFIIKLSYKGVCDSCLFLQAVKIHKSFGNKHNKQEVLKGLDISIEKGEFVSIMGPSGSGKTTLLNVLSSIDKVSQGSIQINNAETTSMKEKQLAEFRKHHLGFIFQDYNLLDTLTVKENILLPLSITKMSKVEAEHKFHTVATELGIYELKDKYPNEISGGQKQRTSAARAFVHEPDIIFADEPTGALDSKSASDMLNKLSEMNQSRQASIVMVTHDSVAASYSSRVIFIKDGQIYSQIYKGHETRQAFFQDIMKTQGVWVVCTMSVNQLILQNLKSNIKHYYLYVFALMFSVALYFAFVTLQYDPALDAAKGTIKGAASMRAASILLIAIVAIFNLYANNIFVKRRGKEIGLLQLIGMTKGRIFRVLSTENFILYFGSLVVGSFIGFSGIEAYFDGAIPNHSGQSYGYAPLFVTSVRPNFPCFRCDLCVYYDGQLFVHSKTDHSFLVPSVYLNRGKSKEDVHIGNRSGTRRSFLNFGRLLRILQVVCRKFNDDNRVIWRNDFDSAFPSLSVLICSIKDQFV